MFGFGKDKKEQDKVWKRFVFHSTEVLGKYLVLKSTGSHCIEKSKITEDCLPYYEACFIGGLVIGLSIVIDGEGKYINTAIREDMFHENCKRYKLLGDDANINDCWEFFRAHLEEDAVRSVFDFGCQVAYKYVEAESNDDIEGMNRSLMHPKNNHFLDKELVNNFLKFFKELK